LVVFIGHSPRKTVGDYRRAQVRVSARGLMGRAV
jgi:hypothetical protein